VSDPKEPKEPEGPDDREEAGLPAAPAPTPGDLGIVLEPLKDLAEAFRAHSESLRSLAEGQARIGKRLERSDRSEAIVQSTKALNDTFRGVQRTQERLMGRIDREGKRPLLMVLGVVGALAVFVGGTLWIVLSWLDTRDEAERTEEGRSIAGLVADNSDRLEGLHERLAEKREESAELERRREEQARRVTELEAALQAKETEIADLVGARGALTRALRENASLSSEVARLSGELSKAREELSLERARLEEKERELGEKERRIAELSGASVAPGAAPSEPAGATSSAVPPEAVTNVGELRRITTVLNGLLLGTRESESYRFLRIGGARGKVLYDVTAVNIDTSGKETKRIEAAECRVVLDAPQRRAELRFRRGHVYYHGVKAPFWGGKYVVQVVNVDPAGWRRSGLTIIGDL
jgi:hypothetical protein